MLANSTVYRRDLTPNPRLAAPAPTVKKRWQAAGVSHPPNTATRLRFSLMLQRKSL